MKVKGLLILSTFLSMVSPTKGLAFTNPCPHGDCLGSNEKNSKLAIYQSKSEIGLSFCIGNFDRRIALGAPSCTQRSPVIISVEKLEQTHLFSSEVDFLAKIRTTNSQFCEKVGVLDPETDELSGECLISEIDGYYAVRVYSFFNNLINNIEARERLYRVWDELKIAP